MKIKKLELSGFKSFNEKSSITFPHGVSAVVGPNGCGKSNIVDAIRWVMGEKRVSQLRGKSMEDVIFSGTSGKPPLNMAEVSLTLTNDGGKAPAPFTDYSEIMVTRRYYRSGENAYFINKQPCRLKDIHNIFLGSGTGTRSYSIISQGNIGTIIDATPLERRFFIEEAAGVSRYRKRKDETLKKLEGTGRNLLRLSDIITELKKQLDNLDKQASRARDFLKLRKKIHILDTFISTQQFRETAFRMEEIRNALSGLAIERDKYTARLEELKTHLQNIRQTHDRINLEINGHNSRKNKLERHMERTESEITHLSGNTAQLAAEMEELARVQKELDLKNQKLSLEIYETKQTFDTLDKSCRQISDELDKEQAGAAGTKKKIETLTATLEQKKSDLVDLLAIEARYKTICHHTSETGERIERRLKKLHESAAKARQRVSEAEVTVSRDQKSLEACRVNCSHLKREIHSKKKEFAGIGLELGALAKTIQGKNREIEVLKSRLGVIRKMQAGYEGYHDGVRFIMNTFSKSDGIHGVLSDFIDVEPSFEAAVEAILEDKLQYIIVDSNKTALKMTAELMANKKGGRCGFISLQDCKVPEIPDSATLPPECTNLLDHLTFNNEYHTVLQTLAGRAIVTETASMAVGLSKKKEFHLWAFVSKDGTAAILPGIVSGGSSTHISDILKKKMEISEIEKTLNSKKEVVLKLLDKQQELENHSRVTEKQIRELAEEKETAAEEETDAEKSLFRASETLKSARRQLEINRLEQEQLAGESDDNAEKQETITAKLEQTAENIIICKTEIETATETVRLITDENRSAEQKIVDQKIKRAELLTRIDNTGNTLKRLQAFHQDGIRRFAELSEDLNKKNSRQKNAANRTEQLIKMRESIQEELQAVDQDLKSSGTEFRNIEIQLKKHHSIQKELQNSQSRILNQLQSHEMELSKWELKQKHIETGYFNRYHEPLEKKLHETGSADIEDNVSIRKMEKELNSAGKRLAAMGSVNTGAIEEYDELKTRYDFLVTQQNDLNEAVRDLHNVIRKINRISQKRFMETFDAINEKLEEVFPLLFTGGTAKLAMTEPAKPIESGVEILIQPPGKRLTRLSLLSGGEKALSAIAFVFSIFLIRPSAFCLLDEIDAPLDDVSINRFNNLLNRIGENSQIIMITHNKKSMEFADMLFGVTMEKKGISRVVSVNLNRPDEIAAA